MKLHETIATKIFLALFIGWVCSLLPKKFIKEIIMKSETYSSFDSQSAFVNAYYDLSPKKRHYIGAYSSLSEAVRARNIFEISLLTSGNLKDTLKAVAKHHELTIWRLS